MTQLRYVLVLLSFLALADARESAGAADPFQRYLKIKNDDPMLTIWPVIQVPLDANGGGATDTRDQRLYISKGGADKGIPPGGMVTVNIPKNGVTPFRWYKSGRVFIFAVNPRTLETRVGDPAQIAKVDPQQPPNLCPGEPAGSCYTAIAGAAFWEDAPAQITEYTVFSKDWSGTNKSGEWPNQDDPRGVPFLDIDVSYVDDAFFPAVMGLDDTGATKYMGTTLPVRAILKRMKEFVENPKAKWQLYAAYSEKNWPNNKFHDLLPKRYLRVPSGFKILKESLGGNLSSLYKATPDGNPPAECTDKAWPACNNLSGLCCPVQNGDYLACCGLVNYSIDNTTKRGDGGTNPALADTYARWQPWIEGTPCANINQITSWPSDDPAFDKPKFCNAFQASVKYLWNIYTNDAYAKDQCKTLTGDFHKYCILAQIVGYTSGPEGGQQPQTVQAVLRNVPWGDGKPTLQYQWDKFLHYWAPFDSIFNLNPFIPFIKAKMVGMRAKSGYSFSIDDQWGNYQDLASGAIIDIGGLSELPNRESFDPYEQYRLSLPKGWNHATICGRPYDLKDQAQTLTFSFWKNGKPIDYCDIAVYPNASDTPVIKYRLIEYSATVTDQWTGLQHEVQGFKTANPDFCTQNTSPTLRYICSPDQTKLEPKFPDNNGAGLEVVFVSLAPAQRPIVSMTMPPPPGE